MNKRSHLLRSAASILLAGVGSLRIIGFYSGLYPLSILGMQFGASPLPLVFSRVHDVDTYARRFSVDLAMADGHQVHLSGDWTYRRALHGPFSRAKLYVDELAFADMSSSGRRQAFLTHAFCADRGVVARELGISGTIERVGLSLWEATSPESSARTFEVSCR